MDHPDARKQRYYFNETAEKSKKPLLDGSLLVMIAWIGFVALAIVLAVVRAMV